MIVQKHTDRVHGSRNDETKKHEERKGYEETKEHEETSIIEMSSQVVTDALSFTEQLKQKFMKIRPHKVDNNIWFQASELTSYLENVDRKDAAYKLVDACDKISYSNLISQLSVVAPPLNWNLQPETVFISQDGMFGLTIRSKMPLAKQF